MRPLTTLPTTLLRNCTRPSTFHRIQCRPASASARTPRPSAIPPRVKPLMIFTLLPIAGTIAYAFMTPGPKSTFHHATIVENKPLTGDTFLLTLRLPGTIKNCIQEGKFTSLEVKDPSMQISRFYTPLRGERDGEVQIYYRRYSKGPLSTYLARQTPGNKIEVRGPRVDAEVPEDCARVLALVGGTGVTTGLQAVGNVGDRNVLVVYCVRDRDEVQVAVDKIGGAKKVKLLEFVDSEGGLRESVLRDVVEMSNADGKKAFVAVSGPEGFVKYYAGLKEWKEGQEVQGALGGLLGKLITPEVRERWAVWKF